MAFLSIPFLGGSTIITSILSFILLISLAASPQINLTLLIPFIFKFSLAFKTASVTISILVTMALVFFIVIGYINSSVNLTSYFYGWVILFIIADLGFYHLLRTWGVKRFEEL